MPPKPTCKVVKREGQRGARIDPKGCKVRTTKDAQGNKRQYNKRGDEKITLKTTGNEMRLVVAGARQHSTVRNWGNRTMRQRAEWRDRHKMIYDTGAQVTSMSRDVLLLHREGFESALSTYQARRDHFNDQYTEMLKSVQGASVHY